MCVQLPVSQIDIQHMMHGFLVEGHIIILLSRVYTLVIMTVARTSGLEFSETMSDDEFMDYLKEKRTERGRLL